MQLMLLYPLIEEKVTDPAGWVDCLIGRIRGATSEAQPAILAVQRQLGRVIDDLGEKTLAILFTNAARVDMIFKNSSSSL